MIVEILSYIDRENVKWVHFGEGYLRDEIEKLCNTKLKNVKVDFRGLVANADILDYYANNYVDLFINVSESEGIPVSIMEATSAGIPVVATNVGGTSEAVKEDFGFLIEENFDSKQVAAIVENYLNSLPENQRQYRKNAHNFWKENFDAQKNFTQFYEKVLK